MMLSRELGKHWQEVRMCYMDLPFAARHIQGRVVKHEVTRETTASGKLHLLIAKNGLL